MLLLSLSLLGAVEGVPPPFDYLQLVQDEHTILLLDSGFAPQVSPLRVTLLQTWDNCAQLTRLEIADSLATGIVDLSYNQRLRQAGLRLDLSAATLRIASRDWPQRPSMDGIDGGVGVNWRGSRWQVKANADHWAAFEHTHGRLWLARLFPRFELSADAEAVQGQNDRWLAGAEVTVPLGPLLLSAGAQHDDAGDTWSLARAQWTPGPNLLLRLHWQAGLDVPPLDSLFTPAKLAWETLLPSAAALDSRTVRLAQARLDWAAGDWRGAASWEAVKADSLRSWGWSGEELTWLLTDDDSWRQQLGGGLHWCGASVAAGYHPGSLEEFEARWDWRAAVRGRVLPYTFMCLRADGVANQLLQGERRTYWTSGLDIEYSGPFRITVGAGADYTWREPLTGESDRRLRIRCYFSYRQGEYAHSD